MTGLTPGAVEALKALQGQPLGVSAETVQEVSQPGDLWVRGFDITTYVDELLHLQSVIDELTVALEQKQAALSRKATA